MVAETSLCFDYAFPLSLPPSLPCSLPSGGQILHCVAIPAAKSDAYSGPMHDALNQMEQLYLLGHLTAPDQLDRSGKKRRKEGGGWELVRSLDSGRSQAKEEKKITKTEHRSYTEVRSFLAIRRLFLLIESFGHARDLSVALSYRTKSTHPAVFEWLQNIDHVFET